MTIIVVDHTMTDAEIDEASEAVNILMSEWLDADRNPSALVVAMSVFLNEMADAIGLPMQ